MRLVILLILIKRHNYVSTGINWDSSLYGFHWHNLPHSLVLTVIMPTMVYDQFYVLHQLTHIYCSVIHVCLVHQQQFDHISVVITDSCNQRGVALLLAKRQSVAGI